jgi:hypothetical protein
MQSVTDVFKAKLNAGAAAQGEGAFGAGRTHR